MEKTIEPILKKIIMQIAELDSEEIITPTSELTNDLSLDSLRMIDLVVDIDNNFNVSINEEELPRLKTFQNLMDRITQLSKPLN